MDEPLASHLLASIETNSLVVIFGAGLSIGAPSSVPSAWELAQDCSTRYEEITGSPVPAPLTGDLGALAEYFAARSELLLFIRRLIPWSKLVGRPINNGHIAIADFLSSGVFEAAITTNVDCLTEDAEAAIGEIPFRSALDGAEAAVYSKHRTLLKVHGCCVRDVDNTVWAVTQLTRPPINERIRTAADWMRATLREKDLLIIGFWSDWSYLNSIFDDCIRAVEPNRVVLIDPQDATSLEAKAPALWTWATSGGVTFTHIQQSGVDFLEDLRRRYSLNFLRRLIKQSVTAHEIRTGRTVTFVIDYTALSTDELYALRRDAWGVPSGAPVRHKTPDLTMQVFGATHIALTEMGATLDGATFVLRGNRIRIIQGSGQLLSQVMRRFATEPPAPVGYDLVICAGAEDDGGAAPSVIRGARPSSIIRAGTGGRWLTFQQAVNELGL